MNTRVTSCKVRSEEVRTNVLEFSRHEIVGSLFMLYMLQEPRCLRRICENLFRVASKAGTSVTWNLDAKEVF